MQEFGGTVSYRKTAAEVKKSNRTIVEYTWNHTTLHAMKVDKGLTYIQSGFQAGQHVQQAKDMRRRWATRCWCTWSSSAPRKAR